MAKLSVRRDEGVAETELAVDADRDRLGEITVRQPLGAIQLAEVAIELAVDQHEMKLATAQFRERVFMPVRLYNLGGERLF